MKKFFFLIFLLPAFVFANGYGIATLVKGSVQVLTFDGKNKILKRGDKIFESDTIVTASKSIVRVVMIDTNIIDVYPNSKVLIKQYIYSPQEDNKNVRLEVATGQIKSTVKQKYDNEKNKYNVKTPAIVAGVRGTIFTTEHEIQTGTSRVFTHEGNVLVGRIDAQENVKDFFSVKANQKIQIDKTIERPQVVEVLKDEIQKQKNTDKEDGFIKPEKDIGGNRSDSSRPGGAINSSLPSSMDGRSTNPGVIRSVPIRQGSENSDGSKSEVKDPSRDESTGQPQQQLPSREQIPVNREDSEQPKREDSPPLKREEAPPIIQPEREIIRPDSDDAKKELENNLKKRLSEEIDRLKRQPIKRSEKD